MTEPHLSGPPASSATVATEPASALKPQKRLFIVLCFVMALWIIGLVTMYFTTVYPYRHASPAPLPHENDVNDHQPTTMVG